MAEPPEMEALARRWIALWQDQLVASASDPELTAALARLMTLTGAALAPWAAAAQAAARAHDASAPAPAPAEPAADRPPPAAAPSRDGSDVLAELARRMAALEERLAQLEPGARGRGARVRERTRRRRP